MAARHRLEMVGEDSVDRGAADRSENRHRLGGELLADGYPESRGDLADQPHHHRGRLPGHALSQDETGALADQSRERGANGEIAALDRCVLPGVTAERENLEAGERGVGTGEVLALLAGDFCDRPQQYRRRYRQFDRQGPDAERAADGAGRGRGRLVQTVRGLGSRFRVQAADRDAQRDLQRVLGEAGDRRARGRGKRAADRLDLAAENAGQTRREPAALEQPDRLGEVGELLTGPKIGHNFDGHLEPWRRMAVLMCERLAQTATAGRASLERRKPGPPPLATATPDPITGAASPRGRNQKIHITARLTRPAIAQ